MSPKAGSHLNVAILAALSTGLSSSVFASGFALIENSASGQGNAYAGAAAIAEDASTIWFNPAGMSKLDGNQIIVAGHLIKPSSKMVNQGTVTASGAAITGSADDGGSTAFVPNFYWMTDINEEMKFGLGVNAPFGLETNYDDNWIGRYHAVRSDLRTVNFNPSISYKVNETVSVGAGFNVMLADVTFTNAIDFGALLGAPQSADGFADLQADNMGSLSDWSLGFNLGLMVDLTPATTLGLAYRSETDIDVEGRADFKVPAAAAPILSSGAFSDSAIYASVTLPETVSWSSAHEMNKVTLLADVTWTGWSSFEELRIKYVNTSQPDSVTTESWEDTMRYSLGVDWQYTEKMTLRTGIAYDETPIPNPGKRTPRVPGNDRTWLSFGGSYIYSEAFTVDVGYSHLFLSNTDIDHTFESSQPALAATLKGSYEASVDILSAQLRWNY